MKEKLSKLYSSKEDSSVTELLIVEISFIAGASNFWCVDFDTINHICNTLQGFQKTKKLSDGEVTLHQCLEIRVVTVSVRVVELFFLRIKY